MSLMTFKDAQNWASSVRDQLTLHQMPPSYVDPTSPPVKGEHPISAEDVDMVVTWASCNARTATSGSRFSGRDLHTAVEARAARDLKIPMSSEHTVAANTDEETADFFAVDRPHGREVGEGRSICCLARLRLCATR